MRRGDELHGGLRLALELLKLGRLDALEQVSNTDQMKARGLAHNGRRDYNRYVRSRGVVSPFDALITSMLRVRSSREILAALHNRCTWNAVSNWRVGWRRPPAWVIARLLELIQADAAALVELASQVETQSPPGTVHPASQAALRRVNAARTVRAASRDVRRTGDPSPGLGGPPESKEAGD